MQDRALQVFHSISKGIRLAAKSSKTILELLLDFFQTNKKTQVFYKKIGETEGWEAQKENWGAKLQ